MISKRLILFLTTVVLSLSTVRSSLIQDTYLEDLQPLPVDDFSDEPVYQPRFLPIFKDAESMGKVVQALKDPGNKTLQDDLINIVADVALKSFGGDETIKKVVEVVRNRGNKTFQEILMNVGAEIALVKFKDDSTIKSIAEILKNPTDEKLQNRLMTLAAEIGDSKLGKDGTLQKVAEVLKKPGNRTLQENLLNVVVEVAISKFGNDELIRKVADVLQNSGNKTVQENLLNLATNVALIKYGNNPIVKLVAEVIHNNGNLTIEERLSAAADAALNGALGPVQAAIIKQGIGIAGQTLKVGGDMLGNTLINMGGDSLLGKAGQAIRNGTQTVGGFMSKFGGGDQGVGLAIEKFGEAMKGGNATIQEAFVKAGSALNGQDMVISKEVDVLANEAQTIGAEIGEVVTEIENNAQTDSSTKADALEENTVEDVVPNVIDQVADNTVPAVSELVAETSSIENEPVENSPDGVSVETQNTDTTEGELSRANAAKEDQESLGALEENIFGVPQTISPQMSNGPTTEVVLPTETVDSPANSLSRETVGQPTAVEQPKTGYPGATVGLGSYPTQENTMIQSSLSQGGNENVGGALGSASAAIEAARHALEAGSEALGGALSNIAKGSGSDDSGDRSPMSVEITTVKLQMG